MRFRRLGAVVGVLAMLLSVSLIVTTPATAAVLPSFSPPPPVVTRVAAPGWFTQLLTGARVIPSAVLGGSLSWAGMVLGLSGDTSQSVPRRYDVGDCVGIPAAGSGLPAPSCAGGAGQTLGTPLSDNVLCVVRAVCADAFGDRNASWFNPGTTASTATIYGHVTMTLDSLSAAQIPTFSVKLVPLSSSFCVPFGANNLGYIDGVNASSICGGTGGSAKIFSQAVGAIWGECKNNSTGALTGIFNKPSSSALPHTSSSSLFNGSTDPSVLMAGDTQKLAFTASSLAICPSTQTLQWVKWGPRTADIISSFQYFDMLGGSWVNPKAATDPRLETITVKRTCGNGTDSVVVTASSVPGSGIVPVVNCPAGYQVIGQTTDIASSFLQAPKRVEEWNIDDTKRAQYPECFGWTSPGCTLVVYVDGQPCAAGTPSCADWYNSIYRTTPSRVKCMWGPYVMDISQCLSLINQYVGETGTKVDPRRFPGAAPVPVDPGGTPLTSNPDPAYPVKVPGASPGPGSDPSQDPGTNPGTSPGTDPGTGTTPGPVTVPGTGTITDPAPGSQNCWPSGSAAFNPVEWVLQPVKCALSWAFVPKTDVQTLLDTQRQKLSTKVPFVWWSSGTAFLGLPVPGGSCPDWVINVGPVHQNVVCDSSFTGAVLGARPLIFGGMLLAMFWPLVRSLWYSMIPILRVTPGSSK